MQGNLFFFFNILNLYLGAFDYEWNHFNPIKICHLCGQNAAVEQEPVASVRFEFMIVNSRSKKKKNHKIRTKKNHSLDKFWCGYAA